MKTLDGVDSLSHAGRQVRNVPGLPVLSLTDRQTFSGAGFGNVTGKHVLWYFGNGAQNPQFTAAAGADNNVHC
jgi:hypothetical protein